MGKNGVEAPVERVGLMAGVVQVALVNLLAAKGVISLEELNMAIEALFKNMGKEPDELLKATKKALKKAKK